MTRHWAPLDGPQRAITHLRARRDGRARTAVDLELPLMALLAIVVGIGVVIWLNGQGAPESGEIRRVTERPQLAYPAGSFAAAAQAKREADARAQARQRRVRAARRRAADRQAALAAAADRQRYEDPRLQQYQYDQNGDPVTDTPGYNQGPGTYTQQQAQSTPAPRPAPKPQPKPQPKRSGGGGGQFDDSG